MQIDARESKKVCGRKGTVANMLKNRLKKLLIISITAVLLYGCYSLYTQTRAKSPVRYAQIVVESPFENVQTDTDILNAYFQEKVIAVKQKMYRDGVLLWETDYDRAGEEIKKVRYKSDGSIDEWVEYECSADGKTSEKIWYHGDGNLSSRAVFKFDDAGNLIESTQYDHGGIITYKSTYAYDEAVHVIKDEYHGIADYIERYYTYQYRYNKAGDIEKEICYVEDGSIGYWHEYQYDEAGHRFS